MTFERMTPLLHNEVVSESGTNFFGKAIQYGNLFIVFLVAAGCASGFPAGSPRTALCANQSRDSAVLIPVSQQSRGVKSQSEMTGETEGATPEASLKAIQAEVAHVRTPSLQALAKALGLSFAQIGHQAFEGSESGMEAIGDVGGKGAPNVVVKWRPPVQGGDAQAAAEPNLYLLSWDGKAWQPSYLTTALDALTVQVLPGTEGTTSWIAVVIFRGMTAVPYPVIFGFRDHHALLAWDGRSATSLYSGHDYGSIQFQKAKKRNFPLMLVAGAADPGLLVFPPSSDQDGRGFRVATVYAWQNSSYVPVRTEYTHNRDYTVYRFIAALHLHEYKTAYSLIDPKLFLRTDKPSLKLFRNRILKEWPEFTDDKIFEVPPGAEYTSGSHVFVLKLKGSRMYVYHPAFTSGPTYRLIGLKRTETSTSQ